MLKSMFNHGPIAFILVTRLQKVEQQEAALTVTRIREVQYKLAALLSQLNTQDDRRHVYHDMTE